MLPLSAESGYLSGAGPADMHERLGIHYINTGDWVESCTAVAETPDGQFELIKWSAQLPVPPKTKTGRGLPLLRRAKTPGIDAAS